MSLYGDSAHKYFKNVIVRIFYFRWSTHFKISFHFSFLFNQMMSDVKKWFLKLGNLLQYQNIMCIDVLEKVNVPETNV